MSRAFVVASTPWVIHKLLRLHSSQETDGNDEEQILGFHLPGELVGLDALGTNTHRCDAVALDTSRVCELPAAKLSEICRLSPKIRRQLNRLMGRQLSHIQEMLLLLGKKSAEGRVAAFLLNMSTRFNERGFPEHEIHLNMSRQVPNNWQYHVVTY